jgi:hypothetical protein
MRTLYVLVAAIVAAVCLASPAMAADPIKTLTKKVTALEKTVKTLKADLTDAEEQLGEAQATLDCLGPVFPVAQFGGVFNGVPEGYLYGVGQNLQSLGYTTALDLFEPAPNEVPGTDYGLMMTWAGSCASEPPATLRAQLRPLSADDAGRILTRLAW